ncbi:MarR family transcriptional regulator [Halomontanus rarus]|uniref:MarR family transcriptional regulator n=1 Tax=Halomontanus rarus TaxID=3034020 RepID=UPI001A9928DE
MRQQRLERDVLRAVAERRPIRVTDLADRVDEHPVAVDRACRRLHDEGHISSAGRGVYDVTERGQRRLAER